MSDLASEARQSDILPAPDENVEEDNDDMSTSSTNSDSEITILKREHNISLQRKLLPYANKMLHICKEIAVMLLVALTYAAISADPPKITKSPAAFPFFPQGSVVKDWYRGQINLAIEWARAADVAFVMFYAPWDAECQVVRHKFEETARLMQRQASFAAVNCWQPGGECRNHYNKVFFWPVLIVYPVHRRGIQYNGPYDVHHMIQFINNVAKPLKRVTTSEDLDELLVNYDAVIVGHVNALPGSSDYGVLYTAALRLLEKDPYQEIAFAVETHSNRSVPPKLELHLWNETWAYPKDAEWQPETILTWIFKKLHQVTLWSFPPGMKSREFLVHLQQRPALVLFTPKNPLRHHTDMYSMLREVGFEYYNCNNAEPIEYWQHLFKEKRYENYVNQKELLEKCRENERRNERRSAVVSYSIAKSWLNNSSCVVPDVDVGKCACEKISYLAENCQRESEYVEGRLKEKSSCKSEENSDQYSAENLLRAVEEEKCRLELLAEKYHPAIFSVDDLYSEADDDIDINGLACKGNASVALIALDSLRYYHFAERLGINILNATDKTAIAIINESLEVHYVMEKPVKTGQLKEFIYNFTQNELKRTLQSYATPSYTHIYKPTSEDCRSSGCIKELNGDDFLPTIMQSKAVIVLYHSKQCFFCQGVSFVYLTAARILSDINSIEFTRIDGDLNMLPWEYTMENYPTILLFPSYRKSESRVFPRSIPITLQNLLNFIIVNLDYSSKLQAVWIICNQTKFEDDRDLCTKSVRNETLSIINSSLREWRVDVYARAEVLKRLQLLKQLHLLLAHPPQAFSTVYNHMKKLEVFQRTTDRIRDRKIVGYNTSGTKLEL